MPRAVKRRFHVADRSGTTVASVKPDGTEELSAVYPGRNLFGWQDAATTSGSEATTNTETGFAGAVDVLQVVTGENVW